MFARAYWAAARAGANMREAVSALESIRERIDAGGGYHEALDTFDEHIGQVDLARLVPAICELRSAYLTDVVEAETRRVRQEFSRSTNAGWTAWLGAYTQIFRHTAWRTRLGYLLTERALLESPHSAWPVGRIRRAAWLTCRERWAEAYDWFMFLAEQDSQHQAQARMLTIAAEIQLYVFSRPTVARTLLKRADELSAGDHLVARGWGELWLDERTASSIEKAQQRFQEMVTVWPTHAAGYIGLADCADAQGDPIAAEAYYQQAVHFAPGEVLSHQSLMNWYGRRLQEREALIPPLFHRVRLLSQDEAKARVAVAALYRNAGNFGAARKWLKRALGWQADYGLAHVALGYVDLEEAVAAGSAPEPLLASAEEHFRKDLAICPEAIDGCRGLCDVAIQREDWRAAGAWCEAWLERNRECESIIRVRQALIAAKLEDWTAAESELQRSLQLEPQNPAALDTLLDLSDEIAELGDRARAEGLLAEWRRRKGDAFESLYQNQLGNWRYAAGEFEAAEQCYRRAVAADPEHPVIRSNLAMAAEELRFGNARYEWLGKAIDALSEAARLAPAEPQYRTRLARLTSERSFIEACGERALELIPVVTPIRVEVPKEMLAAILNEERSELSAKTREQIEAWRRGVRARVGVPVPGIRFVVWENATRQNEFRILIMEREMRCAVIEGQTVVDDILQQVDAFVGEYLHEFVGHQETANLLRDLETAEASDLADTPARLTGFVRLLRDRLARKRPIVELDQMVTKYLAHPSGERPPASVEQGLRSSVLHRD